MKVSKPTVKFFNTMGHEVAMFLTVDGKPHHARLVKAGDMIGTIKDFESLLFILIVAPKYDSTKEKFIEAIKQTVPHDDECTCADDIIENIEWVEKQMALADKLSQAKMGVDGPTNL